MPLMTPHLAPFTVRSASPEELVELRWRVLRAGLPRDEAVFAGDELATSIHVAATDAVGVVVGCATLHLNEWQGAPAYQLRGMATDPACRRAGLGRQMLAVAEAEVLRRTPVRQLWCNARVPAVGFYQLLGWAVRSEEFEIPTAGPHVRMHRPL
jgi:predicted GNAT family N-acyltransferase